MIENQTNLRISKKAQQIVTIIRDMKGCDPQQFPRSRFYRYEMEFIDGTHYGSDSKQDLLDHIRGYNDADYAECFAKAEANKAKEEKELAEAEAWQALKEDAEAMLMTFTDNQEEAVHRAERQAFLLTQAEKYGIDGLIGLVLTVFTADELAEALKKDWYLNGTTLQNKRFDIVQFDMMASLMTSARMKHTRMVNSYASRVSILKAVCREVVRRHLNGGE